MISDITPIPSSESSTPYLPALSPAETRSVSPAPPTETSYCRSARPTHPEARQTPEWAPRRCCRPPSGRSGRAAPGGGPGPVGWRPTGRQTGVTPADGSTAPDGRHVTLSGRRGEGVVGQVLSDGCRQVGRRVRLQQTAALHQTADTSLCPGGGGRGWWARSCRMAADRSADGCDSSRRQHCTRRDTSLCPGGGGRGWRSVSLQQTSHVIIRDVLL